MNYLHTNTHTHRQTYTHANIFHLQFQTEDCFGSWRVERNESPRLSEKESVCVCVCVCVCECVCEKEREGENGVLGAKRIKQKNKIKSVYEILECLECKKVVFLA